MPLSPARTAAAVVTFAVILALVSSAGDSLIVDEIPHIGAGYSYVSTGDMRLNPEHPPLAKSLAGLGVLGFADGTTAFASPFWTANVNGQWDFGRLLIYNSGNNAELIKQAARVPMLLFFVLSALVLWRWAVSRYGRGAGVMAVVLFAFSPTVLAHARFVTTDMPAAFGVLVATWLFVGYLRGPDRRSFVLASLGLGVALLTKFSTVLLIPYFFLVAALWAFGERHGRLRPAAARAVRWWWRTALVCATAFVFVVWPVYLLHTAAYPVDRQVRDTTSILGQQPGPLVARTAVWLADKPVLRAAGHYATGLAMVLQRSAGGNTIYWLGNVVKTGGPWYFPIVYFLKESLAWWILAALAVASLIVRPRRSHEHGHRPRRGEWWADHFDELAMLLWLAVYWLSSVTSTLNIGVRHLLPVYPFTILLVSGRLAGIVEWLRRREPARLRIVAGGIALLMGWYVYETVAVHPYYLTYFNQIAGGPSGGYRYVVDSNLDWGQDLSRLSAYLDERGIAEVELDYFGWADPYYYLGDRVVWGTAGKYASAEEFIRRNRTDGWIAVSATFLQNSNGFKTFDPGDKRSYLWLTQYEPEAIVGHSIFVWHITE
ncbi:MAG TPA: glycosyltransferase family 39 protein [Candidatus Paceibacterota bacterium]|nr:glycosyltransferase family 39 protein [Candidatus Paceibacterota bacterium]